MKLDFTKKSHRFILLTMLAVPIFIIGFLSAYFMQNGSDTVAKEETKPDEQSEITAPSPTEQEVRKTEYETDSEPVVDIEITEQDRKESRAVAEKFSQAYANYDAADPELFVLNAKPYMTDSFYSKWVNEAPRRPLALSKSSVKEIETFPVEGGDTYSIAWNVVVTEETINTLGDIGTLEEWFWVLMDKENGEWKVKDVDITNG